MNRLLVCLLCVACLPAIGETRKDIIDTIRAKEGVTDVGIVREGSFMEGKLGLSYYSEIVWLRQVGNVVKKETGTLIVKEQGVEGKETVVGWLNDVPQFLQPPREQEAIGDEADILAAIGTKVIKPTVEIGKDAAKVTGYEEAGADLVSVAFMVHVKDGQLVSVRLKDTATKVESGLEPAK